MPTPLMPDEEFDAQFRLGFEHYPEQPEDPAAWHRMELLLEADLRQQALRRRMWRLLGAEAILLVLGVWAAFSFLLEKMPVDVGRPPLATSGASGGGRGLTMAAGRGRTTATSVSLTSLESASKHTASATKESTVYPHPTGSATTAPGQSDKASFPYKSHSAEVEAQQFATRRSMSVAVATARSRHSGSTVSADEEAASGAGLARAGRHPAKRHFLKSAKASVTDEAYASTAKNQLATAEKHSIEANKPALHHSKRRVNRSAKAAVQELAVAASHKKERPNTVAASSEKAFYKTPYALSSTNRRAATYQAAVGRTTALVGTASGQPIDLLAPRWPASGLRCQLPDSLALVALPFSYPTDSLAQPKPRPLLSAYRFRLGLVGAPEFSTVRADRLSKPGSSLGVLLEYQLGRRWRVSAGYLYTTKIYVARGTDYTLPAGYTLPHGYVISNVSAACRIVDIPLNLRYDLWQRPRYQVFASVGLSSLLMRREQYTYDYELVYGKPVAPYSWELDNGSQHVLKILNLSAGYERAVGQRWTVQAEPFVKLPLAGVGFGAVRLSSAGVFFSLKYGLLPVHPAPAPH